VLASFARLYRDRFDVDLSEMTPMLAALRTTVLGRRVSTGGLRLSSDVAGVRPPRRVRRARFDGAWLQATIVARDSLRQGDTLTGPAIVEQLDTTTVIEPGDVAVIDSQGNLVITLASRKP